MRNRRHSRIPFALALLLVLIFTGSPTLAQSLDALRASGAVGERYDGFAEALDSSAQGAVNQVNAQRRKIYQQRAAEQGASPDQIGRIYAQQILKKAPAGTKFLQQSGTRITK